MVRLKGKLDKELEIAAKISIPYGAIKRAIKNYNLGEIYKFQFLMVRLKVFIFVAIFKFISLFQFLMVRLKAIK